MGLGEKWKKTGKAVGGAFANFGKAVGTTAKVAFSDEVDKKDANGDSSLKKAWKNTGKGFKEAGVDLVDATDATTEKVVDKFPPDEEDKKKGTKKK